jgi:glycine C-acetyltransferase
MKKNLLDFLDGEIEELKRVGLFRPLRVLQTEQKPLCVIDSQKVVNLSSNNYLGLTTHPRVIKAARDALERFGSGTAAVRPIIGTMTLHEELERKLADFKGTEAAITFQSGFTTNVSVCQSLMSSEKDLLISDELNHASIIDGARLAKSPRRIYKHKNMKELEDILKESKGARRVMIVTDGVFSMDGDIAPLPDIVELAEKYEAFVMVDDAHASGVLGRNGRGTPDHFGLTKKIQIQIGTLSKAIGALGGYVAGSKKLRDFLIHKGRPFLFSSSHPPSVVASCIAAIDVLLEEPQLIERLWENTRYFKGKIKELGLDTGESQTPITPIMIGDPLKAAKLSERLFEEGVFALSIVYPMVARDKARLRTIVTATHTKEDLDFAVEKIKKVSLELGIIK